MVVVKFKLIRSSPAGWIEATDEAQSADLFGLEVPKQLSLADLLLTRKSTTRMVVDQVPFRSVACRQMGLVGSAIDILPTSTCGTPVRRTVAGSSLPAQ